MSGGGRARSVLDGTRRLWARIQADAGLQFGFAVAVTGVVFAAGYAVSLMWAPPTVEAVLTRLDYDLTEVRGGGPVAPVFLVRLPEDLGDVPDIDARKAAFFKMLLPVVLRENARLRDLRRRIRRDPASVDAGVFDRYGVEDGADDRLLLRVDTVPPSLVLAQAAIESGWGTSRFVAEANNLFGHRTYDEDAAGVAPKGVEDPAFKLLEFRGIAGSVRAYMFNLNTHPAYAGFRRARAAARRAGGRPDGIALARELDRYSERGEAYVEQVVRVIRQNSLTDFDGARLGP